MRKFFNKRISELQAELVKLRREFDYADDRGLPIGDIVKAIASAQEELDFIQGQMHYIPKYKQTHR